MPARCMWRWPTRPIRSGRRRRARAISASPGIIEAARRARAEAIHPGYGFLSENADFAEACAAAGIVFIGPPAAAIRAMGSKAAAKALMEKAGVPVGARLSRRRRRTTTHLAAEAKRIGFPVLIKASAGGGGKGMRVVEAADEFAAALAAAKREAAAAFGDDRVLIEKYLTRPRHIEIQVFADSQGNTVHLFERDCSIQRRHQKVIEEAPAPGMSAGASARAWARPPSRRRARSAMSAPARSSSSPRRRRRRFYFMEMNTRLQVEHPVTEMITGLDLVEWQIRVAAGRAAAAGAGRRSPPAAMPSRRGSMPRIPRAISCRRPGHCGGCACPRRRRTLRVDSGVREGDAVSVHYDPMIAKLVAWGEDRAAALRRLAAALTQYRIAGLATNRDFLVRVLRHPAFIAGDFDTGFIERHRADLLPPAAPVPRAGVGRGELGLAARPSGRRARCRRPLRRSAFALAAPRLLAAQWRHLSGHAVARRRGSADGARPSPRRRVPPRHRWRELCRRRVAYRRRRSRARA